MNECLTYRKLVPNYALFCSKAGKKELRGDYQIIRACSLSAILHI